MQRRARPALLYAACAMMAAVVSFVVIVASATIRQLGVGTGCADWPTCYGAPTPGDIAVVAPVVHIARRVHRGASSLALVLVVLLVLLSWRARLPREQPWTIAALLLTIGLAVLGAVAGASPFPAVAAANLLGGFALLTCLACALPQDGRGAFDETPRLLFVGLLMLVAFQVLLGALLSAQHLLTTCRVGDGCAWHLRDAIANRSWNVFTTRGTADVHVADGAALLHNTHMFTGAAVLVAALLAAGTRRRAARALPWTMSSAAVVTASLGVLSATLSRPVAVLVLHGAGAALLCAMVARGLLQSETRLENAASDGGAAYRNITPASSRS